MPLTELGAVVPDHWVVWSPDGPAPQPQVRVVDLDRPREARILADIPWAVPSPNAEWLAVMGASTGQIGLTPVDSADAPILWLERGHSPFWSPDGRRLVYYAGELSVSQVLHVVEVGPDGPGVPRRLLDIGAVFRPERDGFVDNFAFDAGDSLTFRYTATSDGATRHWRPR